MEYLRKKTWSVFVGLYIPIYWIIVYESVLWSYVRTIYEILNESFIIYLFIIYSYMIIINDGWIGLDWIELKRLVGWIAGYSSDFDSDRGQGRLCRK